VRLQTDIVEATRRYEAWLAARLPLVKQDLELKHHAMRAGIFPFLRATFYRWAEAWSAIVGNVADAPHVLAVGDLHVENFGTWRDAEGRLIWGVNDFDETWPLPYTNDLVRLATSTLIAIDYHDLALESKRAVAAILEGYREGLEAGGHAFVLAEFHTELRDMALERLRDPQRFWDKLDALPTIRAPLPRGVDELLDRALPERGLTGRMVHRVAGLGSLGRQRFVVLTQWRGGRIAREAKALAPSACALAKHGSMVSVVYGGMLRRAIWALSGMPRKIHYKEILRRGVRCPDPCVSVSGTWLIRRLAPDCTRIPLNELPKKRHEEVLLYSMGWETANIHLGSAKRKELQTDVKRRPKQWLHEAALQMAGAIERDWNAWRKSMD